MKKPIKNPLKDLFNPKEASFIIWFVVIFIGSAGLLSALGLLPSELQEQSDGKTLSTELAEKAAGTLTGQNQGQDSNQDPWKTQSQTRVSPTNPSPSVNPSTQKLTQVGYPSRLIIPSIDVDTSVRIPKSTDVQTLDSELTQGPVYYPGSGTVNFGNMFIFGHSTGYKVVINKAYKVFNELKDLQIGDVIYIQSEGKTFSYKVKSVDKVNKDQTLVEFDTKSHLLTLSTCNSFGAKTDRYVVVAEFTGVTQP